MHLVLAFTKLQPFLIMKQTMISHAECLLRFIKCLGCRTLSPYVFKLATQLRHLVQYHYHIDLEHMLRTFRVK